MAFGGEGGGWISSWRSIESYVERRVGKSYVPFLLGWGTCHFRLNKIFLKNV